MPLGLSHHSAKGVSPSKTKPSPVSYTLEPIATIHTPFKEKFGIPRQPGLVPAALGSIAFHAPFTDPAYLDGIEHSSHLWLQFLFHQSPVGWSAKVRPPRLGGNKKMGVWATRSPRRPNGLGLSLVRFERVETKPLRLIVGGVDLLDGTPILDIKPYLPYAESPTDASHGFAENTPAQLRVEFSEMASESCNSLSVADYGDFKTLVRQVLAQDPRPAYQKDERGYGITLYDLNLRWSVTDDVVWVHSIEKLNDKP